MNEIQNNSQLITSLVTIIVGAIVRLIEKRNLRKKGLLTDKK